MSSADDKFVLKGQNLLNILPQAVTVRRTHNILIFQLKKKLICFVRNYCSFMLDSSHFSYIFTLFPVLRGNIDV